MPTPLDSYTIPELDITVDIFQSPSGTLCGSVVIPRNDETRDNSLDVIAGEEGDICYYDAAIDGVESLLLALVCEGYDLREERIKKAIITTLDSISNNLS